MILIAILLSFTLGFSFGLWVFALHIGSLARQHGGRYTFSLSEPVTARRGKPLQSSLQ